MDFNDLTQLPRNTEFDFWLGTWDIDQKIKQPGGEWQSYKARTTVTSDLDGHIITEHWEGTVCLPWENMTAPEYRKALSVRSFDPVTQQWSIHWIDTRNRRFVPTYSGTFQNGRGDFYVQMREEQTRISFYDITPHTLQWSFSTYRQNEWQELWTMSMTRLD